MQKWNRKWFFSNFQKYHHKEGIKSTRKQVSNFCVTFQILFRNCESNSNFLKNANVTKIRRRQKFKVRLHFWSYGKIPAWHPRKMYFFQMSCEDFVLASKMKPKFKFLMLQVMPEFSIFLKCDMLQGCDMSHLTNNLYFFAWNGPNICRKIFYILKITI